MSNIRGLGDYGKDDKKDDKKKKNESYIGGEKSGLAVEDADDNDDLQKIINKARQGSQEGRANEVNKSGNSASFGNAPPKTSKKITLYKNGYVIDDNGDEFKSYETPEGKKFVADLSAGYVPSELRKAHPNGVDVGVEDKRGEEFKPPAYVKFKGSSVSIGGGPTGSSKVTDYGFQPEEGKPNVDNSKPTTTVQIRFHNGQRTVLTVNEDCTLDEIFNYVTVAAPIDRNFELVAGFPPAPINEPHKTLAQLNLLNSAITQKIA